jgi:VWFA-related protein
MTCTGRLAVSVVAAISVIGAATRPTPVAARQSQVFRANADAVIVDVSVRRGSRLVTGLAAADFEVNDNGVVQQVVRVSYETTPIDVTVLLDVSGSVSGAVVNQLRQAIADLRQSLQPQDRLRLLAFNMAIQRIFDVDATPAVAGAALASIAPGGSSAVFDSLAVALAAAPAAERRQFVVIFSDGKDSSITTPEMLLDVARRTSPTVSVVLATVIRRPADAIYTDLAAETGGIVVTIVPNESLGNGFTRVLDQFRSSYVLTFIPSGVRRAGAHALDVHVKREGVEVRARRGYVVEGN